MSRLKQITYYERLIYFYQVKFHNFTGIVVLWFLAIRLRYLYLVL